MARRWRQCIGSVVNPGLYLLTVIVPSGTPSGDNLVTCNYQVNSVCPPAELGQLGLVDRDTLPPMVTLSGRVPVAARSG